jgi:hypothetical protein
MEAETINIGPVFGYRKTIDIMEKTTENFEHHQISH